MRILATLATLLTAALLGLATPVFAATSSDMTTRDARMAAALSDFRQQQPAQTMAARDQTMPAHLMHHRKALHAARHTVRHTARPAVHHTVKPAIAPAQ